MKQRCTLFFQVGELFFLLFPLTFIPLLSDTYLIIAFAPLLIAFWKMESYFCFLPLFKCTCLYSKLLYNCLCIISLLIFPPFALLIVLYLNTNIKFHTILSVHMESAVIPPIIKNIIIASGIVCGAIAGKYPHLFCVLGILYGNALLDKNRIFPEESFRIILTQNHYVSRRILVNSFFHNFIYYLYAFSFVLLIDTTNNILFNGLCVVASWIPFLYRKKINSYLSLYFSNRVCCILGYLGLAICLFMISQTDRLFLLLILLAMQSLFAGIAESFFDTPQYNSESRFYYRIWQIAGICACTISCIILLRIGAIYVLYVLSAILALAASISNFLIHE